MGKDNKNSQMVIVISDSISKVNLMEKENMSGMMEDNIRDNSKMV